MEGNYGYDNFHLPVKILSKKTQALLCDLLNTLFILPCESGLLRDWRGLAELIGLKMNYLENHPNPTLKLLQTIENNDQFGKCTISCLLQHLETLDRFDIIDDCSSFIHEDVELYRSLQANIDCISSTAERFDALVLYAEEDIDFAYNLVDVLEKNFRLSIFFKERNLVAGQKEIQSILSVIADKSNKIIVIISPHFLTSPMNEFFLDYAQTIAIELKTRKIVPCMLTGCDLPAQLLGLHVLRYSTTSRWGNFWLRLAKAIDSDVTQVRHLPESLETKESSINDGLNSNDLIAEAPITTIQQTEYHETETMPRKSKSGKISKILTKVKKILPKPERNESPDANRSFKKKREKKKVALLA